MSADTGGDHPEGPDQVKSSLSFANGNCVEVAIVADGQIRVRNSRDRDGQVLLFTSEEWRAFLAGVREGEFDGFGMTEPSSARIRDNRYSFLQWVLATPGRTLRFALLLVVLTAAAVLAPHLVKLLW
jgi:hypothetical protein